VTWMSESRRDERRERGPNLPGSLKVRPVARPVHQIPIVLFGLVLLLAVLGAACVVPPPLEVDNADAAPNSPPVITQARDAAANSLRPPATLTVNVASQPAADIEVSLYDPDATDDLTLELFVDYDPVQPLAARLKCGAPATDTGARSRTTTCTTNGLCVTDDLTTNPHRLEIEVYDRAPADVTPYREPGAGGFFSTWTLELICIDNP